MSFAYIVYLSYLIYFMIITIDGPAGTGKSTVAKKVAQELGFLYLDTGAMYRACSLWAARQQLDWDDPQQLADRVDEIPLRVEYSGTGQRTWLGAEDVSQQIRTPEVTEITKYAAGNPTVREYLGRRQREIGRNQSLVTEGRDQGTAIFPDADLKIYLEASPQTRANRRCGELQQQGRTPDFAHILQTINERDEQDKNRAIGPLKKAEDAVEIQTDDLTADQVVEKILALAKR